MVESNLLIVIVHDGVHVCMCMCVKPADSVDAIMDELHHLSNLADLAEPVAANAATIREQLEENTVSD